MSELARGVFRSDDDGQNFLSANAIKDTSFSNLSSRTIRQLVIDPNNSATLYALSAGNFTGLNEIFKTTNRGDEWEGIGGQTTLTEFSLSVDPGNSNNVFVGTNGGIFRSTDGGGLVSTRQYRPSHRRWSCCHVHRDRR